MVSVLPRGSSQEIRGISDILLNDEVPRVKFGVDFDVNFFDADLIVMIVSQIIRSFLPLISVEWTRLLSIGNVHFIKC